MATRCKGCDVSLLMVTNKRSKDARSELEDLCGMCRSASFGNYNYSYDHRYVLQDAEDGDVSQPYDCSGY